jgi:hypothetical protein
MKYAVEMGSGVMINTPSFVKIGSVIQNLIGGDSQTQNADRISLFLFYQAKKSRLNVTCRLLLLLTRNSIHVPGVVTWNMLIFLDVYMSISSSLLPYLGLSNRPLPFIRQLRWKLLNQSKFLRCFSQGCQGRCELQATRHTYLSPFA